MFASMKTSFSQDIEEKYLFNSETQRAGRVIFLRIIEIISLFILQKTTTGQLFEGLSKQQGI